MANGFAAAGCAATASSEAVTDGPPGSRPLLWPMMNSAACPAPCLAASSAQRAVPFAMSLSPSGR